MNVPLLYRELRKDIRCQPFRIRVETALTNHRQNLRRLPMEVIVTLLSVVVVVVVVVVMMLVVLPIVYDDIKFGCADVRPRDTRDL